MLREAVRRDGRDQVLIKNRRGRRRRHKRGTETGNEQERTDGGADSGDTKLCNEPDAQLPRPAPSSSERAPGESKGNDGRVWKAAGEKVAATTKRGDDRQRQPPPSHLVPCYNSANHQMKSLEETRNSVHESGGEGEGAERHREAKDPGEEKRGVDVAPLTFRSETSDSLQQQASTPASTQSERRSYVDPPLAAKTQGEGKLTGLSPAQPIPPLATPSFSSLAPRRPGGCCSPHQAHRGRLERGRRGWRSRLFRPPHASRGCRIAQAAAKAGSAQSVTGVQGRGA